MLIDECQQYVFFNQQHFYFKQGIHLLGKIDLEKMTKNINTHQLVIGVDEAGRGPLLGNLAVASAILLPEDTKDIHQLQDKRVLKQAKHEDIFDWINDSKKLTETKRDKIYHLLQDRAMAFCLADVPVCVIDEINILQATMLGMKLSIEALLQSISNITSSVNVQILIDGNRCPTLDDIWTRGIKKQAMQKSISNDVGYHDYANGDLFVNDVDDNHDIDMQAWVKGDARHTSIAAASILAKVFRDKQMYALAERYPKYGIEKHKGYPTKAHLQAIDEYGVLAEHRRSFSPIKAKLG